MDQVDEPPWVQRARSPLKLLSTDRLLDQRDDRIVALVVAVGQGPNRACFFVRFHPGSLLTANILYLPETDRGTLLAELTAGQGPAASYRFTRRLRATDDRDSLIALVGAMLEENELNLRMGTDFPPYPPDLAHLSRIGDVTVVPALLVLLRKFLLSACGIPAWKDVERVVAESDPPRRLLLGSDALESALASGAARNAEAERWSKVSRSTDYPDGDS